MKIRRNILLPFCIVLAVAVFFFIRHREGQIRLIVRGDDMGFSHGANVGCIQAYQEGILTAVEVMVPCDYFLEAVEMLNENPGLDVGVHLTLNSEWENVKWGPVTEVPSLVDENGYFLPMTWPDEAYPPHMALGTSNWKLEEIEKELRAQIETALEHLPHCTHATPHMGFNTISPQVNRLTFNLIKEYNLDANIRLVPYRNLDLFENAFTTDKMISKAVEVLENLGPGTWQVYEHPALIIEGEEGAWHIGAEEDAIYRDAATRALISKEVQEVIQRRKIKLIGYSDL